VATPRSAQTQSYSLTLGVSSRIATGFPDQDANVLLFAVAPPAATIVFSSNIAALNQVNPAFPTGDCAVITVGSQAQSIRLAPGVGLFARPSADGAIISVTTTGV
jgi:hypothetical protein